MFARENNMGDISGKMISQYTTSNLMGMAIGMFISKGLINVGEITQIVPVMLGLSAISTYYNYKSVTVIDESFINKVRGSILMDEYLKTGEILGRKAAN